jgi:hypothetical protein
MQPTKNITTEETAEIIKIFQSIELDFTKMVRAASITPVMGFIAIIILFEALTMVNGYITGVKNIKSWVKNGKIYLMSRYFTLTEARNVPKPQAARVDINKPNGKIKNICGEGIYPNTKE